MSRKEFYTKLELLIEMTLDQCPSDCTGLTEKDIGIGFTLQKLINNNNASEVVNEDLKYALLKIREANIWLSNLLRSMQTYD